MMKKTLVGLGLTVALALPMGLSVAAAQEVSDDPPVTIVDQDQVREQTRQHDCDLHDGDAVMDRDQVRDRDHAADRDCELCDGDAVRAGEPGRDRVERGAEAGFRAGLSEGSPGVGNGEGVSDGTGPLHDGPENGTGNNRGMGRR